MHRYALAGGNSLLEGHAIVIDIGKTQAKVSLWSADGRMLARTTRRNDAVVDAAGSAVLDTVATTEWVLGELAAYAAHPVRYIVPVAHGAAMAAVKDGALVVTPPDYEDELPAELLALYRAQRDGFAETGSPALPAGLNLGAQLFGLVRSQPDALAGATLLPYAQYWAWLLTGTAVSEATSLGCHSDLWSPAHSDFSPMAKRHGWDAAFAPVVKAADVVGTLTSGIAERTGLSPKVEVLAGLHDSNAALLAARGFPEIEDNEATVLSTGTWFIAMRLAKGPVPPLPEARDCLVNVDAYGQPVPSARFMGGREIETLIELDTRQVDIKPDQPQLLAAVAEVVASGAMVLPTLALGNGPFPEGKGGWVNRPKDWFARRAGACLYAALVADASLDLIGSKDRLLVEGRFAEAEVFVRALASLRPDTAVYVANAHNDVSFGALRLVDPTLRPQIELRRVPPLDTDISAYAENWRKAARNNEHSREGLTA